MVDSVEEKLNLKNILNSKKKQLIINKFQIENKKINSIFIKKENKEIVFIDKNIKVFSEIDENILNESDSLDFGVEIEIIPFGKFEFENEKIFIENKDEKKKKIDSLIKKEI